MGSTHRRSGGRYRRCVRPRSYFHREEDRPSHQLRRQLRTRHSRPCSRQVVSRFVRLSSPQSLCRMGTFIATDRGPVQLCAGPPMLCHAGTATGRLLGRSRVDARSWCSGLSRSPDEKRGQIAQRSLTIRVSYTRLAVMTMLSVDGLPFGCSRQVITTIGLVYQPRLRRRWPTPL